MSESTHFRQFPVPSGTQREYVPIGRAAVVEETSTGVLLQSGATTVELAVLAPDLFRVGMFQDGRPPRYDSEAIARAEWALVSVERQAEDDRVRLATSAARAWIQLDPLRIHLEDHDGRRFAEDDPELGMGSLRYPQAAGVVDPLGAPARVYKRRHEAEHYFGCGERTGGLEKTHAHLVFWNFDPPHEHTPGLNNLYLSIPFLLVLEHGRAWGLFFDNRHRVEFDLAREHPERAWFGADGGDLIYYVFAGPSPRAVLERYTELTGRTPLPPHWALGNHQSRWGYRTAEDVLSVAREFRSRDIPCDALYLDIDYMDGYRVFTWDRERFPDPAGLIATLGELGFHVVTIVDPGVKVDEQYQVYREGRAGGRFCRTFEGAEYQNVVWPGVCAFPDFTDPAVRDWWGEQHRVLLDQGVAGIWCDMNEPTVFLPTPSTFPGNVVHPGGGEARLHAQVHNVYGSLMAQASRDALVRFRPDRRPFVISRAGYAGLQRHALHWTGDNSAWWEHIALGLPQLQNLGLSGLAWAGVDIGGFTGDATGELLTRWTEAGIFFPFYRNHSAWDTRRQEPWAFGPTYEAILRKLLKLRQRLLPYLYSVFEECHRTGAPILRPLLFDYPDDTATYSIDDQFLLGDALLIAPILRPGIDHRAVYLPAGDWCHFWSGLRFRGPDHILARAPLGEPAVYIRANRALPLWPEMAHVGERPPDPLTLLVFAAIGEGSASLYEDAGEGFAHEHGVFARARIDCQGEPDRLIVRLSEREGDFVPPRSTVELRCYGLAREPDELRMNGVGPLAWRREGEALVIELPESREARQLELLGSGILAP